MMTWRAGGALILSFSRPPRKYLVIKGAEREQERHLQEVANLLRNFSIIYKLPYSWKPTKNVLKCNFGL